MAQLLEGTDPLFSVCSFLFVVVATLAFNLAGGFSRSSGAYVFFYSVLAVILGLCTKVVLVEPGDSNLLGPRRTILVFLAGICSMYMAVFISRKLTPAKGFLEDVVTEKNLQNATVGCLVTGLIVQLVLTFVPATSGGVVTALAQINRFLPMALILGTLYQIRRSGGRSSVNLTVLIAGSCIFFVGLYGFSKEGIFTPLLCWLMAAASQNYRVSRAQIVWIGCAAFLMFFYLVPYAQYGRSYQNDINPSATRWETTMYLLNNLSEVRRLSKEVSRDETGDGRGYFKQDVGLFERLQMISVDDELINVTERDGTFGMLPIYMSFGNLVPHFIWAGKPTPIGGNAYAHQIGGVIAENDTTTGISFSPTGEAYHLEAWLGIFLLAPALWIMLFVLFDSLCGDARSSPWALLVIVVFGHIAPEGMLGGIIYAMGFIAFGLVVAAVAAAHLMPILGTLVKGPERTVVHRVAPVRSVSRRTS